MVFCLVRRWVNRRLTCGVVTLIALPWMVWNVLWTLNEHNAGHVVYNDIALNNRTTLVVAGLEGNQANSTNCPDLECVALHAKYGVPRWQQRLRSGGVLPRGSGLTTTKRYFLTAALPVRIYADDKAQWTIRELKQWIHYMLWAGVEHIYLCDHNQEDGERLDVPLDRYVKLGLVTYIDKFNRVYPPFKMHISCWTHVISTVGNDSEWQLANDMDEYPYTPGDIEEAFLHRYLATVATGISEVSMHNFLMHGGDHAHGMMMERITRIVRKPPNHLDKPIYRPLNVRAGMHHMSIKRGKKLEAPNDRMKMLHYWGHRLSDWGPITEALLNETEDFFVMRDQVAPRIRNSLLQFGEFDAFCNHTGP